VAAANEIQGEDVGILDFRLVICHLTFGIVGHLTKVDIYDNLNLYVAYTTSNSKICILDQGLAQQKLLITLEVKCQS
jgi:hypothetical protein